LSRTKKKTPGIGKEYWSRPRASKTLREPGRYTKQTTNRHARRTSRTVLRKGMSI